MNRTRCKRYLDLALDCLFRSTDECGFWDGDKRRIVRALHWHWDEGGAISWRPELAPEWRYAPFALMGALMWRNSTVSHRHFDLKLKAALDACVQAVDDPDEVATIPSYGAGTLLAALSLAYRVFGTSVYESAALALYDRAEKTLDFEHSEDMLVLFGMCTLHDTIGGRDSRRVIAEVLGRTLRRQDWNGIFVFRNRTTRRHQNQMYTLWALSKAVAIAGRTEGVDFIERTLRKTAATRMLENGALLWEDLGGLRKATKRAAQALRGLYPYWKLLFECHQTFFVNAVHYYNGIGDSDLGEYTARAMEWIYAGNILQRDLVEISGIGVPMRVMTIEGNMAVRGQMFKGAYEIGSYIMALTHLLESGQ